MSTRGKYPKFQPPTHVEYGWDDEVQHVPEWDEVPRWYQPYRAPYQRIRKLAEVRAGAKLGRKIAYYSWRGDTHTVLRLLYQKMARPLFPRLTPLLNCLKKVDGTKNIPWGGGGVYFDVQVSAPSQTLHRPTR